MIAQNAGTLARLCACFNIPMSIIEPASFIIGCKEFKRAGMDYIDKTTVKLYDSFESYKKININNRIILLDTKATDMYYDFIFNENDCIMVGSESTGVPDTIYNTCQYKLKIPMNKNTRSLNVAISAAIVLSEALRQLNYFSVI
ncbi:MAG: tRNA methyltransferase [Alphaproteobacteria bacterium]|nr:tRNA methyltransferase [Alphaproteobacteria bacterium]